MPSSPKRKDRHPTKHAASKLVSVADAKAHFSSIITGVQKQRTSVTILKRGVPVAEIIPVTEAAPSSGFGWMRGSVQELGDIVGPSGVEWTLKDE